MQRPFWQTFWRGVFKRWVPALGMLGAGLAAVGAYWAVAWLTLAGALVAVLATMISTVRQAEFRDRLSDANKELIEANKKLARQAEDIAGKVTGGDSYAYASLQKNPAAAGRVLVNVVSSGRYPLYDVKLRIYSFAEAARGDDSAGTYTGTMVDIGTIPAASAMVLGFLEVAPDGDARDANLFFTARNGFWMQEVRGRNIDGDWFYAWRVSRDRADGSSEHLAEEVPPGFPLGPDGRVDWAG